MAINPIFSDISYQENNNGVRLNRESGILSGVEFAFRDKRSNFFYQAQLRLQLGTADYRGQSQSGQAVNSKTDFQQREFTLLGGIKVNGDFGETFVLGGVYVASTQRDIRGSGQISGLDEHYQAFGTKTGIGWEKAIGRYGKLSLQALYLRSFQHDIDIDFNGVFDSVEFELAPTKGIQVAIEWSRQLNTYWRIGGGIIRQEASADASKESELQRNGLNAGSVFQPARDTDSTSLRLIAEKKF